MGVASTVLRLRNTTRLSLFTTDVSKHRWCVHIKFGSICLVAKVRIMVAADPQQMVLFHWKAARFLMDDWSLRACNVTVLTLTMTLLPGSMLPWQSNYWRHGRLEYDFGKYVSLQSINVVNLKCSIIECH